MPRLSFGGGTRYNACEITVSGLLQGRRQQVGAIVAQADKRYSQFVFGAYPGGEDLSWKKQEDATAGSNRFNGTPP
ncbi:hypothetical protein ACQ86N_10590 [Puia sp. P3]|uniref:hypothetical protein n=1 Tax=Puia sp. P3 TaxID=3423952 RepID=UPI003D6675E9